MTLNILAIEAALAGGSLSIRRHDGEIISWIGQTEVLRSESLLGEIDNILKKAALTAKDLDLLAASAGPGGFTGIRIGLATALGLSRSLAIPFCSVSMLRAAAEAVPLEGNIKVALPMGQGFVCVQDLKLVDGRAIELNEPRSFDREDLKKQLAQTATRLLAAHGSLAKDLGHAENIIDLGYDMAQYVARHCDAKEVVVSEPLFISKNYS